MTSTILLHILRFDWLMCFVYSYYAMIIIKWPGKCGKGIFSDIHVMYAAGKLVMVEP